METPITVRPVRITNRARQLLALDVMSRPEQLTREDAISQLTDYHGYGQVSARGLLALADRHGSYSDGGTTVKATYRGGYTITSL